MAHLEVKPRTRSNWWIWVIIIIIILLAAGYYFLNSYKVGGKSLAENNQGSQVALTTITHFVQ